MMLAAAQQHCPTKEQLHISAKENHEGLHES